MLSETQVADGYGMLECGACNYQYELWSNILRVTGAAEYGYRVFAAMALQQYLKDFGWDANDFSMQEWNDLQSVRKITLRIEEHKRFEAAEAAKKASKS